MFPQLEQLDSDSAESKLYFVAACCTVWHVVLCCSMLYCVAACCTALQHVVLCCSMLHVVLRCSMLYCVGTCCTRTRCMSGWSSLTQTRRRAVLLRSCTGWASLTRQLPTHPVAIDRCSSRQLQAAADRCGHSRFVALLCSAVLQEQRKPTREFSGGWRMRVALAQVPPPSIRLRSSPATAGPVPPLSA